MLNLGGPATLEAVEPFLLELFADREIIQLPAQSWLGPFIARRRTPAVQRALRGDRGRLTHSPASPRRRGGGWSSGSTGFSPDDGAARLLRGVPLCPPKSEDALRAMRADGVERAVAFTQYPQFSCATTGSSLNELWRALDRVGLRDAFRWSIIDRWPVHDGFIERDDGDGPRRAARVPRRRPRARSCCSSARTPCR